MIKTKLNLDKITLETVIKDWTVSKLGRKRTARELRFY